MHCESERWPRSRFEGSQNVSNRWKALAVKDSLQHRQVEIYTPLRQAAGLKTLANKVMKQFSSYREVEMKDCIFCNIIKGDIPCFKVFEDDRVLAFADINPITQGHTLIIPKNHAENIWEINAEDLTAVHLASGKIAAAMQAVLKPEGIAVLQLNGRAVNQVVMHYHLHLIPRSTNEPSLTMTEWELVPGDMKIIEKTAGQIAAVL